MSSKPAPVNRVAPSPPSGEKVAEVSYREYTPRSYLDDDLLIGRSAFSRARNWNRVPLESFYDEALDKYGEDGALDPAEEKRIVRKIDWRILPCLSVCYAFYYVDKTTLSYAAIFGIKDDLKLARTEYNWLSSIFYFGWLFWALPSNMLMLKSPSAKYLSVNIFLWGALLMCQATSQSFFQLAVLRVLSGAFEAIADPAFMLITTMFYTRPEQPARVAFWYSANGFGVAAGGLLGYAIGHIRGALASWRYEFLIVGALCCAWSFVLWFILPDSPPTARFLSREERLMAVARLRKNQTGVDTKTFKWEQVREALLEDPKTWLWLILGIVSNIPNGGISNFSTIIIEGLGFNTFQTALLGIPQGVLIMIWIGSAAYINSRLPPNNRLFVCILYMMPTIAGTLGFLLAPQDAHVGRLICYYLTGSYQAAVVVGLSVLISNTAGQTKKQITSAMFWIGGCAGNISGPFFYRTQDAPKYHLGIGSMLVANCLEVAIFVVLRFYLPYLNRRREKAVAERKDRLGDQADRKDAPLNTELPGANATTFSDLTDRQNINFRYVY